MRQLSLLFDVLVRGLWLSSPSQKETHPVTKHSDIPSIHPVQQHQTPSQIETLNTEGSRYSSIDLTSHIWPTSPPASAMTRRAPKGTPVPSRFTYTVSSSYEVEQTYSMLISRLDATRALGRLHTLPTSHCREPQSGIPELFHRAYPYCRPQKADGRLLAPFRC
jgi:hypothetical protein